MVKKENLFASQGGNIILAQVCHVPLTPAQPRGGGGERVHLLAFNLLNELIMNSYLLDY